MCCRENSSARISPYALRTHTHIQTVHVQRAPVAFTAMREYFSVAVVFMRWDFAIKNFMFPTCMNNMRFGWKTGCERAEDAAGFCLAETQSCRAQQNIGNDGYSIINIDDSISTVDRPVRWLIPSILRRGWALHVRLHAHHRHRQSIIHDFFACWKHLDTWNSLVTHRRVDLVVRHIRQSYFVLYVHNHMVAVCDIHSRKMIHRMVFLA